MTAPPPPPGDIVWGNAFEDGSQGARGGWFVGHFLDASAGPAASQAVEVKWGTHKAGAVKAIEGVNRTATTLSILVSGRFRLDFPNHGCGVVLEKPGDYAIWDAGVSHRWRVIEDAVIVTVRWPSLPDDQHAAAGGSAGAVSGR